MADRATDIAIGRVDVEHERRGEAEVGYELLPDQWGRGLATEAMLALLEWTWTAHPDPSVIAVTQMANTRSRALLDRLGFRFEATFEEYDAPQARYHLLRPTDR